MGPGIIATDARGVITFMNSVAETVTGYTKQEALGTPAENIVRTDSESLVDILQNPSLSGISDHTILIPRNKVRIPIEAVAVPIKSDGIVTGVVLIFCDTTKRAEVGEADNLKSRKVDKTRVLLEPEAEKKLNTTVKFWLNSSDGYIINKKKPRKCFDIFVDLVTHGVPGFVISREHPEKVRRKYNLQKTPMLWLSKSGSETTIDPHDLSKLIYIIEDFTRKSEESVVLLDGVEYLITQTTFDAVMKHMHELKDIVVLHNSCLIIPQHRETLSVKECCLLERDFTILEGD